jgi:glycopeptide antibiotics resistance protein
VKSTGNNSVVLWAARSSFLQMKYGKLIFWLFTAAIIGQAIAPINGVNSKLNNTFVLVFRLDYLVHVAMFACLAVLFRLAYFPTPGFGLSKAVLFFGIMFLTAFFSEAIQWLVSYRVFNVNDLVANFIGVLLSIPLMRPFGFFFRKRKNMCEQL